MRTSSLRAHRAGRERARSISWKRPAKSAKFAASIARAQADVLRLPVRFSARDALFTACLLASGCHETTGTLLTLDRAQLPDSGGADSAAAVPIFRPSPGHAGRSSSVAHRHVVRRRNVRARFVRARCRHTKSASRPRAHRDLLRQRGHGRAVSRRLRELSRCQPLGTRWSTTPTSIGSTIAIKQSAPRWRRA